MWGFFSGLTIKANLFFIILSASPPHPKTQSLIKDYACVKSLHIKRSVFSICQYSLLQVEFTFDKAVMSEILTACRDMMLKLVATHLTPKSHGRINHVFNHYSDPEFLTQLYNPDGPFKSNLNKICNGLNKLLEEGKL